MGCDIHTYVEKKVNGNWHNIDAWHINEYYDPEKPEDCEPEYSCYGFDNGRDYQLFANLAGVRGEYPWSLKPKGFPEDAAQATYKEFKTWDMDAHTPSYLTYGELLSFSTALTLKQLNPYDSGSNSVEEFFNDFKDYLYRQDRYHYKYIKNEEEKLDLYRIVFWFDN